MHRAKKLLVTFLVVGAAGVVILWNTNAEAARPAYGVAQAKREAEWLGDREVAIRGMVVEGSVRLNASLVESFVVAEGGEQIRVEYHQAPPDNFGPKDVVAVGRLVRAEGGTVSFHATSIQVGCSSKY